MAERKTWGGSREPARSLARYRRRVLTHPGHVLVLAAAGIVALAVPWVAVLVVVISEVFVLGVLPRLAFVQRGIDARALERRHLRAALERAAMVAQMSEEHRRDFGELEQIVSNLRIRMDLPSDGGDVAGLEDLAELYLRLALAHRAAADALTRAGHVASTDDVERARALLTHAADLDDDGDVGVDAALARRLDILRLRADTRRRARRAQRAIEIDLATVGDAIRWMSEYCATAGADAPRCELASRLATTRESADIARELISLASEPAFGVIERMPGSMLHGPDASTTTATLQTRVAEPPAEDSTSERSGENCTPEAILRAALRVA